MRARDFVDYWIDSLKSLEKGVIIDFNLLKRITEYTERATPQAKERMAIVNRQTPLKILTPLLTYNFLGQMAQTLETGLNSIFCRYFGYSRKEPLERLINASKGIVEPPPEIEWLVVNNTKKKHETETRGKLEKHIQEIMQESQKFEKLQEKIEGYLKNVEEKLEASRLH